MYRKILRHTALLAAVVCGWPQGAHANMRSTTLPVRLDTYTLAPELAAIPAARTVLGVPADAEHGLAQAFKPPRTPEQAADLAKRRGALLRQQTPGAALALYRNALYHTPDDVEACFWVARLAQQNGELPLARQAYQHLLELALSGSQLQLHALSALGQVSAAQGDWSTAARTFDLALILARDTASSSSDDVMVQQTQISTWLARAQLSSQRGAWAAARADSEDAVALARRLATATPPSAWRQYPLWLGLVRLGDLALQSRHYEAAARHFTEALAIARRFQSERPDDADWSSALWTSLNKLGDVDYARRQFASAEQRYRESLPLMQRCAERHPQRRDCIHNLTLGFEHIARIALQRQDFAAAQRAYDATLTLRRQQYALYPEDPETRNDLALALNFSADLARRRGQRGTAIEALDQSLGLMRPLLRRPTVHASWRLSIATTLSIRGDLASDDGDITGARQSFRECLSIAQALVQQLPDAADGQLKLADCQYRLGRLERKAGHFEAARLALQAAHTLFGARATQYPDDAEELRRLALSHTELGMLASATGDAAAATQNFTAALPLERRLVALDPNQRQWRYELAFSLGHLADLARARSALGTAQDYDDEARALLSGLVIQPSDPIWWAQNLSAAVGNFALHAVNSDVPAADDAERRAVDAALLRTLAARFPQDDALQHSISISQTQLGLLAAARGDLSLATSVYEDARQRLRHLTERQPDATAWQRDQINLLLALARLHVQRDQLDAARALYSERQARLRELIARLPNDPGWPLDLSINLFDQGRLASRSGDLTAAQQAYEQSCSLMRSRYQQEPVAPNARANLALCLETLGATLTERTPAAARDAFRESRALRAAQVRDTPQDASLQQALLSDDSELCSLEADQGDFAAARQACAATIAGSLTLPTQHPARREFLVSAYLRLSDTALAEADPAAAGTALERAWSMLRAPDSPLLHDPDAALVPALAYAFERLRDAMATQGDFVAAERAGQSHLQLIEYLSEHDTNPARNWRGARLQAQLRLGDIQRQLHSPEAALAYYTGATSLGERWLKAHPDDHGVRYALGLSLLATSDIAQSTGDLDAAWRASEASLTLWRQLMQALPDTPLWASYVSSTLDLQANIAAQRGDKDAARQARAADRELYRTLVARQPAALDMQVRLINALFRYAEAATAQLHFDDAEQHLNEGLVRARRLAQEHPDTPGLQHALFVGYADFGLLSAHRSRFSDARTYWTQARDINARLLTQRTDPRWLQDRERISESLAWLDRVLTENR